MFFSSFVLLFFLLQTIAIIFDDAIYLFIYFLHLFQCYCVQVPYQKLFRKWAREMKKQQLYNSKQIIIILPMKYEPRYHNICWRRGGLVVNTSDKDPEVGGVRAPLGSPCCVLVQDIFTHQNYW